MTASLLEHGQKSPVLVVSTASELEGGRDVLIDGYQRVRALCRLGRDLVETVRLELAEADALVLCQKLDGRRRLSALEEGWFLCELVDGHGLRPAELALRLERSSSWVGRRLSLVKVLPTSVQVPVRKGRLQPQVAMKLMVPWARANTEACERLVERLGTVPWSVRQMERLYAAVAVATEATVGFVELDASRIGLSLGSDQLAADRGRSSSATGTTRAGATRPRSSGSRDDSSR